MDSAVNEALRALNTANLRRYTDLQCPKARRRRLKAVQRLVRVLLGDPNVVCGTNTKGEVCLSGGACTALSGPLGGHLALTAQEHEALSMLRMACSMHLSQRALLRMPRRCTQRDLPSASRATEKDFDLTSTKVFLTSPPFQRQFVDCLKEHVPTVRTPGGPMLWVVVHVMVKCIEGLYELWRVRELHAGSTCTV